MNAQFFKPVIATFMLCLGTLLCHAQADTAYNNLQKQLNTTPQDTNRIKAQLKLAAYLVNKPGEDNADLQKATAYARQALALSRSLKYVGGEGEAYTVMAASLREGGNSKDGKAYAEKAVSLLEKTPFNQEKASAYMELAAFYSIYDDFGLKEKTRLYEEAVKIIPKNADKLKYADALKFLGDLHNCLGKFDVALPELKQALSVYQSVGYKNLQDIYDLLGYTSIRLGFARDALNYGLASMRIAEAQKDSSMTACAIYNRLAIIYHNLEEHEKSVIYLQKALKVARQNHAIEPEINIITNLGNTYRRLKLYSKSIELLKHAQKICPPEQKEWLVTIYSSFLGNYIGLKNYKEAERYCNMMLAIIDTKNSSHITLQNAYHTSMELYMRLKKFDRVAEILKISEGLTKDTKDLQEISQISKFKFKLDSANGRFQSAITHYQRYKTFEDSLSKRNKERQVSQLQVQYDTEKKDQDIALKAQNIQLLTKQGQLQEARLQNAALLRNVIIAGTVLLAILLGVIYNRFKLKKRSNEQLEEQQVIINRKNHSLENLVQDKDRLIQDKEWLLKEIHHRVKNNLQIVISLLNTQSSYLDSKVAMAAIQESQHRIRSISLIHQKLYQSDNLANIDMFEYISELVTYLEESFDIGKHIEIELLVEPMDLDVAQAVPVGLILNEAITNCIKYAFANCRHGKIIISLDESLDGTCTLTIADNGCGLPEGFDVAQSRSLGMSLMYGLTRQIDGKLQFRNNNGLEIGVTFTKQTLAQSDATINLSAV